MRKAELGTAYVAPANLGFLKVLQDEDILQDEDVSETCR
jgi:hypothetical protein